MVCLGFCVGFCVRNWALSVPHTSPHSSSAKISAKIWHLPAVGTCRKKARAVVSQPRRDTKRRRKSISVRRCPRQSQRPTERRVRRWRRWTRRWCPRGWWPTCHVWIMCGCTCCSIEGAAARRAVCGGAGGVGKRKRCGGVGGSARHRSREVDPVGAHDEADEGGHRHATVLDLGVAEVADRGLPVREGAGACAAAAACACAACAAPVCGSRRVRSCTHTGRSGRLGSPCVCVQAGLCSSATAAHLLVEGHAVRVALLAEPDGIPVADYGVALLGERLEIGLGLHAHCAARRGRRRDRREASRER